MLHIVLAEGQNLVPNPSFEDTVMCPDAGAQVARAKHWNILKDTPDYFHECCVYPQYSIPQNSFGYQWPATGEAYIGMFTYSTLDSNYREIVGTYLTTPLTIGERYFVSFKTSLAFNPIRGANVAASKVGILFSTNDYLTTPPPINNYCQVYSALIISDTILWTTVKGSFVADSAYQFISISSFFTVSKIDTLRFYNNNWYQSYYYIDDVCVSADSMYCEELTNISDAIFEGSGIEIYPNPVWDVINIDNVPYGCKAIEIYNTDGKLVQTIASLNSYKTSFDVSSLAQGIYSIIFKKEKAVQVKNFIKSF